MKTRMVLSGLALCGLLSGVANAQVLGSGSLGGGLGGAVSGGMRDMSVLTQGNGQGAFGADLETGALRRSTQSTLERTRDRTREGTARVRDQAATARGDLQDSAATRTADAARAVDAQQLDTTGSAAGSLAGQLGANTQSPAATSHSMVGPRRA